MVSFPMGKTWRLRIENSYWFYIYFPCPYVITSSHSLALRLIECKWHVDEYMCAAMPSWRVQFFKIWDISHPITAIHIQPIDPGEWNIESDLFRRNWYYPAMAEQHIYWAATHRTLEKTTWGGKQKQQRKMFE